MALAADDGASAALADMFVSGGQALSQLGWRDAAGFVQSQALKLAPEHGQALLQRGEDRLRQRHWGEAIDDSSRAAEFPALRHTALLYRSLAHLHLGRHGEGEADRRLLQSAYGDFSNACRQLGNLCERRDDEALAMVFFQAALHFHPDQPMLANQVAWFLATGPEPLRDPVEARLRLVRRAVDLQPKNWMPWNTLGVCHDRLGHWQDAIAALEKSLQLSAASPAPLTSISSPCVTTGSVLRTRRPLPGAGPDLARTAARPVITGPCRGNCAAYRRGRADITVEIQGSEPQTGEERRLA